MSPIFFGIADVAHSRSGDASERQYRERTWERAKMPKKGKRINIWPYFSQVRTSKEVFHMKLDSDIRKFRGNRLCRLVSENSAKVSFMIRAVLQ